MISAETEAADLCVIGAGAAGLATAIFTARAAGTLRIVCVDGARRVGAKILVSGGSRCNVTNREVTERDFWGGSPRFVRNVLRAFPAGRAIAFFSELGVALHEEEDGKDRATGPGSNSGHQAPITPCAAKSSIKAFTRGASCGSMTDEVAKA